MTDELNAFLPGPRLAIDGAAAGPLAGLTFAAKDLFDVAGEVTGAGNPDWARTHGPASAHSAAVAALLAAGASLRGKTHTDELAFSLNGENAHYGTPANPRAPGRVPGGSSSGSASAVAGGAVDFAIGTDTGGSIRVPASYCGIYGIRTTHGAVPTEGLVPLAAGFDTVGWFAREAEVMARVGRVLLPPGGGAPVTRLVVLRDAFALADEATRDALAPHVRALRDAFANTEATVAPEGLGEWLAAFRPIQMSEAWASHGAWIEATEPAFGPGIRERFAASAAIPAATVEAARARRAAIRAQVDALLPAGTALVLPTAPGIAPRLNTPGEELEAFRVRAMSLTCIAGLCGLPQLSLPVAEVPDGVDRCPVGLSLIGARGADLALLDLAASPAFPLKGKDKG